MISNQPDSLAYQRAIQYLLWGDIVIWTKYKFVVLLSVAAVAMGIYFTLASFNHMVAPAMQVKAFNFEGMESGAFHLEILGENMVVERPVLYSTFFNSDFGRNFTGFIHNGLAGFREKYFLDSIYRMFKANYFRYNSE
ncbi:MAG: hypothetical protein A4E55_01276 [Pelotomaculum sp. PtaU1.Bin035]|nr:MAG: hypothetical protein A4E55_01276 [Pelotomaculum sp. PtaU1.Bin035]